jgi:Ser/Thr protein kinase RdoA (MazF antagonist)
VADASFAELGQRAQISRLRPVALAALAQYPFGVVSMRVLNHGFNTTFRVDTSDGRRFALRLNVNSRRTPQNLAAEAAWLAALAAETDLSVPMPQQTREGRLTTSIVSPDLERSLPAVLFSWLPGRDLGEQATTEQLQAVGRTTAVLHEHGARWRLPAGAALPPIDSVLMDVPYRLGDDHPLLSSTDHEVIDAAFEHVQRHIDELFAGARRQPLHADIHGWNLKWFRGRLSVFDFDDSGVGVPAQDLAISAYYLRDDSRREAALLEGYQAARSLPQFTTAQFEAMVASRNLVLLNDVITTTNAEFLEMLPRYVPNSITKLRAYLDSGVYRHDVPGLLPQEG